MTKFAGILAAAAAFILWGILPVYWKLLQEVPAYEILCHRMSWSLVFTLGLVLLTGRRAIFTRELHDRKNLLTFSASGLLLALNWFLYIWAVNSGFIVEASLGYFINPLLNVLFGMIFFGERMRLVQWLALFLAFLGVIYLTVYYGRFPWIALVLAFCFALYGLLHKKNSLKAIDGLCLETGILFIPAVMVLLVQELKGSGAWGGIDFTGMLLLMGSGLVTTVPLLLFGFAAHRIPLSTLGLLQYLGPTINLLLGVFLYGEEFPQSRMVGFTLIWAGLIIFMAENLLQHMRMSRAARVVKEGTAGKPTSIEHGAGKKV